MFKLGGQTPTYWQVVRAMMPSEAGGEMEVKFDMRFKRMTMSEVEDAGRKADETPDERLTVLISEIAADWKGVGDTEGNEPPFTREGVKQMVENGLAPAILTAFRESLPRAKAKN